MDVDKSFSHLKVSIIACTHNRSAYLDDLIASLCEQAYPAGAYEIIIIDNQSTDQTKLIVDGLRQKYAQHQIGYVYEARLGFSYARNAGLQAARYEWVAFIDDDAVAHPDWLANLAKALQQDDEIVSLGGRIELQWDCPRPAWLPKELEGFLGNNSFLGNEQKEFSSDTFPFGGNMVVKRDLALGAGGFDTNFGRVGEKLRAHGETRISDLLRSYGKIVYVPKALIYHRVPASRTSHHYFLSRGYHQGVANANLENLRFSYSRFELLCRVVVDLKLIMQLFVKFLFHWLVRQPSRSFLAMANAAAQLGHLHQTLRIAFKGKV